MTRRTTTTKRRVLAALWIVGAGVLGLSMSGDTTYSASPPQLLSCTNTQIVGTLQRMTAGLIWPSGAGSGSRQSYPSVQVVQLPPQSRSRYRGCKVLSRQCLWRAQPRGRSIRCCHEFES
jgi:hypothetical protein